MHLGEGKRVLLVASQGNGPMKIAIVKLSYKPSPSPKWKIHYIHVLISSGQKYGWLDFRSDIVLSVNMVITENVIGRGKSTGSHRDVTKIVADFIMLFIFKKQLNVYQVLQEIILQEDLFLDN